MAVLVSLVGFFLSDLYPHYLAPLFNTFTPLDECGELAQSIRELARQLDFPLHQILVVDGSRRVGHSNAYITGFVCFCNYVHTVDLFVTYFTGFVCSVLMCVIDVYNYMQLALVI